MGISRELVARFVIAMLLAFVPLSSRTEELWQVSLGNGNPVDVVRQLASGALGASVTRNGRIELKWRPSFRDYQTFTLDADSGEILDQYRGVRRLPDGSTLVDVTVNRCLIFGGSLGCPVYGALRLQTDGTIRWGRRFPQSVSLTAQVSDVSGTLSTNIGLLNLLDGSLTRSECSVDLLPENLQLLTCAGRGLEAQRDGVVLWRDPAAQASNLDSAGLRVVYWRNNTTELVVREVANGVIVAAFLRSELLVNSDDGLIPRAFLGKDRIHLQDGLDIVALDIPGRSIVWRRSVAANQFSLVGNDEFDQAYLSSQQQLTRDGQLRTLPYFPLRPIGRRAANYPRFLVGMAGLGTGSSVRLEWRDPVDLRLIQTRSRLEAPEPLIPSECPIFADRILCVSDQANGLHLSLLDINGRVIGERRDPHFYAGSEPLSRFTYQYAVAVNGWYYTYLATPESQLELRAFDQNLVKRWSRVFPFRGFSSTVSRISSTLAISETRGRTWIVDPTTGNQLRETLGSIRELTPVLALERNGGNLRVTVASTGEPRVELESSLKTLGTDTSRGWAVFNDTEHRVLVLDSLGRTVQRFPSRDLGYTWFFADGIGIQSTNTGVAAYDLQQDELLWRSPDYLDTQWRTGSRQWQRPGMYDTSNGRVVMNSVLDSRTGERSFMILGIHPEDVDAGSRTVRSMVSDHRLRINVEALPGLPSKVRAYRIQPRIRSTNLSVSGYPGDKPDHYTTILENFGEEAEWVDVYQFTPGGSNQIRVLDCNGYLPCPRSLPTRLRLIPHQAISIDIALVRDTQDFVVVGLLPAPEVGEYTIEDNFYRID